MVTGLIGKKVGMTQLFGADGVVLPVTVIKAGPCVVAQVKTVELIVTPEAHAGTGAQDGPSIPRPLAVRTGAAACASTRSRTQAGRTDIH